MVISADPHSLHFVNIYRILLHVKVCNNINRRPNITHSINEHVILDEGRYKLIVLLGRYLQRSTIFRFPIIREVFDFNQISESTPRLERCTIGIGHQIR